VVEEVVRRVSRREIAILIERSTPLITKSEDLQWLVEEMRSLDRNYDVAITAADGPPRYGGGFSEFLTVWIPTTVGAAAINQIARLMVDWMKARFSQKPDGTKVTRIIRYEAGNGEVLEIIEVRDPHKPAEYKVPTGDELGTQPMPPLHWDTRN